MSVVRRGLRRISELPLAASLVGAYQEIEGNDGLGYKTPVGSAISTLTVTEERPGTPSPYDDEFDSVISPAWTQVTGTGANYSIEFSRLMPTASVAFRQTFTIANPMRLRLGIMGHPNTVAYYGARITLQGATRGVSFNLDGGSGGIARRTNISRLTALGVWDLDLFTNNNPYQVNASPDMLDMVMMISATNVSFYMGDLGSPMFLYTYALSNLGALSYIQVGCDPGMSLRWFRVDRPTNAWDFPVAWAG